LTLDPKLLWSRPFCTFTRPLLPTADMRLGNIDFVDLRNLPDRPILIPGFKPL
jgi:hypothetical protein